MEKKCPICGAENAESSCFCNMCGTSIETKTVETVVASPKVNRPKKNISAIDIRLIARNAILLLLSLILFATIFLPVLRVDFGELVSRLDGLYYDVSPVRSIQLFIDQCMMVEEEDFTDQDLYEDFTDLMEDVGDIDEEKYEDLSAREKRTLKKLIHVGIRLANRHEETSLKASMLLSALASICYVVIAICAFVFSIINLINGILGAKSKYRVAATFVSIATLLLPVIYYSLRFCMGMNGMYELRITDEAMALSGWVATALVLLGALAVYSVVERLIVARSSVSVRRLIVNAIVLVLAISTILMLAAPVVGVSIDTVFEGRSENKEVVDNLDAKLFTSFDITTEKVSDIYEMVRNNADKRADYIDNLISSYGIYSVREVKNGEASGLTSTILLYTLASNVDDMVVVLFVLGVILAIFIAVVLAVIIARTMLFFLVGSKNRGYDIALIVLVVILSMLFVILCTAFVVVENASLDDYEIENFSVRLGAGPVLLFVFAIFTLIAVCCDRVKRVIVYDTGDTASKTSSNSYDERPVSSEPSTDDVDTAV